MAIIAEDTYSILLWWRIKLDEYDYSNIFKTYAKKGRLDNNPAALSRFEVYLKEANLIEMDWQLGQCFNDRENCKNDIRDPELEPGSDSELEPKAFPELEPDPDREPEIVLERVPLSQLPFSGQL